MEIDGQLWRLSRKGGGLKPWCHIMSILPINPHNLSCVHPIMSYNVSAFHHLGVINPLYLRSLRSKTVTVDIIPVYCSNEARFRVQCAEQWARGKLWALSWRWTKGQTVGRGLIASCKVIPPPLPILSTVHCVAIYNKLEQLECVSVEYLWSLVTSWRQPEPEEWALAA